MAWRPSFLAFGSYCSIGGPACRRFDGIAQHYAAIAADVVLKWGLHDCLWYFLGLSAVLIEKDYLTLAYIQVCFKPIMSDDMNVNATIYGRNGGSGA